MKKVKIAPAPGRVLRDHTDRFKIIPEGGKSVILDRVFKKRIAQGDAVEVREQRKPAPATVKPAEPQKPVEDKSAVKQTAGAKEIK